MSSLRRVADTESRPILCVTGSQCRALSGHGEHHGQGACSEQLMGVGETREREATPAKTRAGRGWAGWSRGAGSVCNPRVVSMYLFWWVETGAAWRPVLGVCGVMFPTGSLPTCSYHVSLSPEQQLLFTSGRECIPCGALSLVREQCPSVQPSPALPI